MALLYKKYLSSSARESSDEEESNMEEVPQEQPPPQPPPAPAQPLPELVPNQVGPPVLAGMPLNPTDPFYMTTCFVCGEKAKGGQEHIRNYGGIACFRLA